MPFIPVPQVCQVELIYSWLDQRIENVLHYKADGVFGPDDMMELANNHVEWFSSDLRPEVAPEMSLVQIDCTDLSSEIAPAISYSTGLPLAGSNASPTLPSNVAICLTKRTVLRGRSYRGRIYQGGLVENGVTGNTVFPTYLANILAAYENLKSYAGTLVNWDMVVVSRYSGNAPRVEGVTTNVTNFTSDGFIDSQRRRLTGRGQ